MAKKITKLMRIKRKVRNKTPLTPSERKFIRRRLSISLLIFITRYFTMKSIS